MIRVQTLLLFPEPDRRADHEDVRSHHPLDEGRPLVRGEAVFGDVGVDARREVMVDPPDLVDRHPRRVEDGDRAVEQALYVMARATVSACS